MPAAVNAEGVVRPRKSKSGDSKGGCGLALHLPPAGRPVILRSSDASGSSRFGLQEEKGGDRSAADPHYRRGFPPLPGSRPADLAPPARTLHRGALFKLSARPSVANRERGHGSLSLRVYLEPDGASSASYWHGGFIGAVLAETHYIAFSSLFKVFPHTGGSPGILRPGFASRLPVVGGSARWARAPFGPRSSFIPVP